MDIRLPTGEIVRNVPEGMSKADLVGKLRAGGHDMSWIDGPASSVSAQPEQAQSSLDSTEEPAAGLGTNLKRVFGFASPEEQAQAEHEYDTEGGVAGAIKNVGQLTKRSAARLGEGLTELPAGAVKVVSNPIGAVGGVLKGIAQVSGADKESLAEADKAFENPLGDASEAAAETLFRPVTESAAIKAPREWAKQKEQEAVAALTPKARRALELSLVEHDEDTGELKLGEGAKDPWWWTANVIDVGVQAAPGMGVTGLSARLSYAAKYRQVLEELAAQKIPQSVAIKAAEKQALAAATRSAVVAGGLTEGAVGGGGDASETRATIDSLDEETLMNYPGYVELRDKGLSHEQARDRIASDKAAAVAISTGAAIGLTGAPMNAFFGRLTAKLGRTEAVTLAQRARAAGQAAVGEAAQEGAQEGIEQTIQNVTEGPLTGAGTWDHVLENSITGFTLGGVVGGVPGALLHKSGKPKTEGEDTPAPAPSALQSAEAAYEAASQKLREGMVAARDPNVKMKYADLQALREEHKKAMVDFTRELLHTGNIPEDQQGAVTEALKQAAADGVTPKAGTPAGGDVSPARDKALEAAANAEMMDENDANDLISNKLAKVNPRGVIVLTPEGRRARKAAQERAAAAEAQKTTQPKEPVAQKVQAKPKATPKKPAITLPAEKREVAAAKAAQRATTGIAGARARRKADKAVTPESIVGRANELAASDAAHAAAGGKVTENPQMREAFKAAADRARRARTGLGSGKEVAFSMKAKVLDLNEALAAREQSEDASSVHALQTHHAEESLKRAQALYDEVSTLQASLPEEQRPSEARLRELMSRAREAKSPTRRLDLINAIESHLKITAAYLKRTRTKDIAFRLKGAPETVDVPGKGKIKVEPVPAAKQAAAAYRAAKGITTPEQTEFARVDPKRAKRIAAAFEQMKHAPNDPTVKRAYHAMIDETKSQWDEIKKTGLKVEFIKPGQADPYAKSPRMAIEDVRDNNHLWVYPTDSGFGSDDKFAKDNPMLEDAGETVGGHKLKNNDVFRIVHDYFGHVQEANGFRADGEENAWRIHAGMYSPLARRAMTTETRGQNSWVNYGPHGETNRTAKAGETKYADQKIGLLPAEFSSFPGETLKFKHFSTQSDDHVDLDPEQMGTGTKGAEAKRAGPKVTSLYAENGDVEPEVSNGRTRYNVEIPKEDLYDGSADPQRFLAQSQVPYGMTTDAQGNTIPVGHRFDMNKFEEQVRNAGYLGYHLPEAQGILKGQARLFQKYPATKHGLAERDIEVAARMKRATSEEKVRGLLTPEENARLKKASARKLIEVFDELPSGAELASSALAGQAKRGWYRHSAEAISNVFGPDAPRFAALLAALSPQTSVEWNFKNAVAVWVGWDKAGRPQTRKAIMFLMREHLFPSTNKVGKSNILPAWINNTVRALTAEDASAVTLSGPKVDSFAANLRGETERVTLDAWMANWAGVQQELFKGEMNVAGDNPGMRPGYLAYAARVREAAQILSERTGETWTPAEVQETVWSWAKTLYEQAESFGSLATARELVENKELNDELINATPDFAGQFADPDVSSLLQGTVYGPRAARSAGEAAARAGAAGKTSAAAEQDQRYLRKAADRLDALRKSRQDAESQTREDNAMSVRDEDEEAGPDYDQIAADLGEQIEAYAASVGVTAIFRPFAPAGVTTAIELTDLFADTPGGGNGTKVMQRLTEEANKAGIAVMTRPDGPRSRAFYERFGFTLSRTHGLLAHYPPVPPEFMMRRGASTTGISHERLQAVAARVKAELGVDAHIADTQADLPDYIQEMIPEGANDVTGMFVQDNIEGTNEIWYVRENLDSEAEAYENALHEAVGHMGLRAVLGKNYHRVMEGIRTSFPAQVAAAAKRNGIDMNHADPATRRRLQSLAAEEMVAYAAGRVLAKRGALSEQNVWRKIIAKVREMLRGVGLLNSYNDKDIEALIYRARGFFTRKPAATRAQEIAYQSAVAKAVKAQPADAPQWLDPSEYLSEDTKNIREALDAARVPPLKIGDKMREIPIERGFDPEQRQNAAARGQPRVTGDVDPEIVFSGDFDDIMKEGDDHLGFGEAEAIADGKRIGYITLSRDMISDEGWEPTYVYVNPRYRGKGVAQRLHEAVSKRLGIPPAFPKTLTPHGRGMWNSFKRREVAFRMKNRPQTQTPAFKEWFGNSKVVDEDGEPRVVYHGTKTPTDFDVFHTGPRGKHSGIAELGAHFGSAEAANDRIGTRQFGYNDINAPRRLVPVYLSIKNPLRLQDRGTWGAYSLRDQLQSAGIDTSSVPKVGTFDGDLDRMGAEEVRDAIEAAGYDGVVYQNGFEGTRHLTDEELAPRVAALPEPVFNARFGSYTVSMQEREPSSGHTITVNQVGTTPEEATQNAIAYLKRQEINEDSFIAFRPEQIKSAVGNTTFNPELPSIAFAFKQGPTGNADLDSFISKIGVQPKTLRQRWNEFRHDLKEKAIMSVFDELHGIQAAEEIAGVPEKDQGYVSARLSRAAPEVVASIIEHGPPVWNDGAPDVGKGMGLLSILAPLKGNVNLWLTYVTGLRAERLKSEGRENLFTANEIAAAKALGQQHPEFDVARQRYNQLQKQVLDFAQEAGVIDPQTRAMWEHSDYIPFHRIMSGGEVTISSKGGKGIGFIRNQIKQLKGGRQNIGDPLENIVRNWQALMDASLQAVAGRMTIDNLNGTGLVTPHKFVANAAPIPNLNALLKANPNLATALQNAGINIATMPPQAMAGLQKMIGIAPPAGEDVVSVWRNGKKEFWHVHDPNLFRSLKNINPKLWGPWMKLFSYPKHIVTKTVTMTPQFMVKNFWRDVWHSFVTGAQSDKTRINMLPTNSLAGLASALANSPEYKSMVAGGGGFGESFIESGNPAQMAGSVRRSINKSKARGIVLGTPIAVWRFYRMLQNAAENANRVAVFRKGLKAGLSRRNALYQARDLMDFSMRGNAEIIRLIVGMTPFFNARLQGLYRLGRGGKAAFASTALRGLLISAASLALLAANHDDDRYKALTDQEKSNYWHFFVGDGHYKLPKPFEVGTIFGTIPEAIGDAMITNADEPDAVLQSAKFVGYSFGETLNLAPQPATVWPMVELAINQDTFTGSPILTQGDQGVLPEDQRGPQTSSTYAQLARLMPDDAPEALRSPKQLEHLGRGYIGNIQDYVLAVSDALVRKANGEPAAPEKAIQDIPGLRDFYRLGPARNTRHIIEMYKLADEAAKVTASIDKAEKAESTEGDARVEELEQKYPQLLDVADDFKKAAQGVTDLKKEQRQIQLDDTMTPEEKRAEMDDIQKDINDIAKDVYDLRPGGKLNPKVAGDLLTSPPSARAIILRKNNMPATADLLEQLA